MMRVFYVLSCLLLLAGCEGNAPVASEETSPSGLHYSLIQMPGTEDAAIQMAWPTDWVFRNDVNQAVPAVGKDLLLAGGAEGYPPGSAGEKFADLKAEAFINPVPEFVIGGLKFKKATQTEAIAIANAHLRAPSFDEHWFERARNDWAKNAEEADAKPQIKLFNTMRWAVLGPQPLRASLSLDIPHMFADMTREDVVKWHKEVFTHNPKAIVVAGNLTPQEAGAMIDKLLEGLPASTGNAAPETKVNYSAKRILLHVPDAETSQLVFARSVPPTRDGKEMEDLLITTSLGSGDDSVLFKAVRTGLRASYGFEAGTDSFTRSTRFFYMTGQVETAKLADTEAAVRKAYMDFVTTGPTADLAAWKAYFADPFEKMRQTPDTASVAAIITLLDGQPASRALNLRKELDSVTTDGIKTRLAEAFPKSDDLLMIAVSPDAAALPGACVIEKPEDVVNCK